MFIEKVGEERFYPVTKDHSRVSVTTVIGAVHPKSPFLVDWMVATGKEKAQEIKETAGEEGHVIHEAVERLRNGEKIRADELTSKGRKCIAAFVAWYKKVNPKILENEIRVDCDMRGEYEYAGTIDLVVEIDGERWVVDVKTSNNVWPEHFVQVSAYVKAWNCEVGRGMINKGAILHLNSKTKQGYSWNEVDLDKWTNVWNADLNLFYALYPNPQPKFIEYPEYFTLVEEEVK